MLALGTAVCWSASQIGASLRGKIVAHILPGISPAQAAPEIVGLKWTQVKFGDPHRPRAKSHYLVRREERGECGKDRVTYYLPLVSAVQPVTAKRSAR